MVFIAPKNPRALESFSKEDLADLAAALFNFQLLGPSVILDLAENVPWLVERAPKPGEMEGILDLARRGKTIAEADERYFQVVRETRERKTGGKK
jgi:hypothetical protein